MGRETRFPLVFIPLDSDYMADVTLIKDLAMNLIMALAKHYSPNDIIEGIDDSLDAYESLLTQLSDK